MDQALVSRGRTWSPVVKRVAIPASSTQNGLRGPRLRAFPVLEDLAQVVHVAVEGLGKAGLALQLKGLLAMGGINCEVFGVFQATWTPGRRK